MIRLLHLITHKYLGQSSNLTILMWHKILPESRDNLTITETDFKLQLDYLLKQGLTPISLKHLKANDPAIKRPVLLTFDDGYQNNIHYAYPHLKKLGLKATMFLPLAHLGKDNSWDEGKEPLLASNELLQYQDVFEYALHSYAHNPYSNFSRKEICDDVYRCYEALEINQIPYYKALAYPYGKRPKLSINEQHEIFKKLNLEFTFRIGNRFNKWPLSKCYDLERFDVTPHNWKLLFRWL